MIRSGAEERHRPTLFAEVGLPKSRDLTGLRPYAGAVDRDDAAAFSQTTQERFGERGIAEEVLSGWVW